MPSGGAIARRLREDPPRAAGEGEAVIETLPTDQHGNLEPPDGGDVVMSVPSPESLSREAGELRRVISQAGTGTEPLVVVIEAAEELPERDLAAAVEAAQHASRPVILRVARNA